ncbi:SERTA domain-containing protein 1 [Amblyraja radiata]|uniref:SERTA domain-containing protein 1 n=1 Tax=Amblyraja radiata TaxID=386614 RepID=UPI00140231BA|nr:SERTA domain-containing protein 1 [Amblyraja radiata]XP_032870333.1 SERTA domain-containing protein 1 [Amblyraja radiata]XP_032870334.1 SERTA domain-containing protein 1 [Amblyraja radiata]
MAAVRFTRGVKRKRAEDGDEDEGVRPLSPPLAFRCEALLDLSLHKLHQGCTVADRNLRRSVLIANTLRRLQAGEGRSLPPQTLPQPEAPDPNNADTDADTDANNNLCLLLGDDATLSIDLHDLDYPGGFGGSPPIPEEDPPLSPTSRPLQSVLAELDMGDSDAFLTDCSLDDIFSDIDTSMYDGQTSLAAGLWDPLKPPDPAPFTLERPPWDYPSTRTPNGRTEFTDLEMVMDLLAG